MKNKSLFIFDMDGVIVDTEPLYIKMNKDFLSQHNAFISDEAYNQFIGISATTMWDYLREKYHLPFTTNELIGLEKQAKYDILDKSPLKPIDGIVDLLDMLKSKNYRIAIASSSMRKNIELIISKTNLNGYFDCFISGEDIQYGKPAPDIFLKAMNHFHEIPENCIVLEDSKNGVLAANAANMFCIGFQNKNSGNQDLSTANRIVKSISEVGDFISSLN
jgi:HAD superfamily hydrolase (TIGR01509 family)